MGWFKLISPSRGDMTVDTRQSNAAMTRQHQRIAKKSKSDKRSVFGTNLLRNSNRYSVSARIRHGHSKPSTMLSSPSASSYLLLLLVTFAYIACTFADPLSQDPSVKCSDTQFRCDCGLPRCIDKSLVKNQIKDCQDGSDEGQWDPSKCAIKNTTSEDIRFKREALPDVPPRVMSNGDATTQFFTGDRARTRPVGLLSTNLGAFVTSGTTTEYLTKILGTYIKGTYARIISTSSKVYHAVPTDGADFSTGGVKPTGFIASTVSTEVNGYATTLHTTDYYRTYIDGTYAQLVSSYSNVQYPSWYTEQIDPTAAPDQIFATKASDHISFSSPAFTHLPHEVRGNFVHNNNKAVAEVGVVVSSSSSSSDSNRLRAFRPNVNGESELRVTGTHGKFVHTGSSPGDETTYNVFTGSYVQNSKTFLFFFGNTAIDASKSGERLAQTIMVENGTTGSNVLVDMTNNLRVIVPSQNKRVMVDGSLNGEHMDGVIVEIEGSEPGVADGEDGITVGGASAKSTPSDPRIDMITVNLNKSKDKSHRVSTSSSSSSSVSSSGKNNENDNEIPRARKVQSDASSGSLNLIRPSRTRTVSLPTFTVGQPDVDDIQDSEPASSTTASSKVIVNVESSSTKSKFKGGAPVFQKPTTERIQKTTERIQSYSKNPSNSYTPTYKNAPKSPNRNHRAFAGFDMMAAKMNDIDSDLQSAATTGRATVTYVGFADFTTTVGNTVIVFMPRTKMIEDLSVTASADFQSPKVEPTRFVYQTEEETTTQRRPDDDDEPSFGRPKGRKVGVSASVSVSSSTTPRDEDEETTTEISPSEAVREVSGRQTLILGNKKGSSSSSSRSRFSSEFKPIATPALRPSFASKFRPSSSSSSSSSSSQDRRNSFFSNSNRPRYTPKLSKTSEVPHSPSASVVSKPNSQSGVYQVASTQVFQADVVNPTGLVTSIDGTLIRDKTTYLFTSLVYGTYIGSSYAQVIKSTSRLLPVKPTASAGPTLIRPTPIARFPRPSHSRFFNNHNDEVATTESPAFEADEEGETTIRPVDRMEISVSSTTERGQSKEDEDIPTTTNRNNKDDDDSYYEDYTTTTEKDVFDKDNEIERRRKVAGQAKDQIIVDDPHQLEATPASTQTDEEQTIYVTRTQPTTVYRTYTYYTTYFIPKEESTVTSVTSREVTSTSVGLVRKTYSSIKPSASLDSNSAAEVTDVPEEDKSSKSKQKIRGKVRPSGAQVIYKTFFTTFTYLTTFFTGQTSSIKSREEIVSNVVTLTTNIGSTATTSVKIRPTASAALRSRAYKTMSPRLSSSAKQGGATDNVGVSSPGFSRYSSIRKAKLSSKIVSVPPSPSVELKSPVVSSRVPSKVMEPVTVYKTFYTTYTYFTTLFNGDETSIKSRTEVVTNVVPTISRTAITPTASVSTTEPYDEYEEEYEDETESPDEVDDKLTSATAFKMSNKNKQKETTFYTTYTYLTTSLGQDGDSQVRSSLKTFTNVLVGDKTIRSGMIGVIEPTKLTGRSAGRGGPKKTARPFVDEDDLNEVGSHVSETSETTVKDDDDEPEVTTLDPHQNDYYELEGSETPITTDRSIFDEDLERKRPKNKKGNKSKNDDDENGLDATPILKTYFTTFTYYTTYYQDGSSTVASRLETKTQVVSDTVLGEDDDVEPTVSETEALLSTPVEPVTYYTTFTYWTTSSIDGSTIINSREETVTNVVTPGGDEPGVVKTVTPVGKAVKASGANEIVPTAVGELELTTFFTTFTYYTTSYIGDSTVVNSRLETVTNVITGSDSPTVSPTKPDARAIGTHAPNVQKVGENGKEEYQDYDLQTGLLSTIVSSEVVDRTTTVYSTDVFGTYIDGIYAQVLESTSSVITPTAPAETRFLPEASETSTGVVSVNEGKTIDAEGVATTFYGTTAYGTVIDGTYAHLVESTSSIKRKAGATEEVDATEQEKTGLVRIIDGTLVDGDHTTYYTSSILGTFIGGQYAQVIESTSRYVINPTKTDGISTVGATRHVEIESSITEKPGDDDDDDEVTTTEKSTDQEEEEQPKRPVGILPGRRPAFGRNRNSSSRLSYKSSSKTTTPAITPFASRSRPSGFKPRGRNTQSISPTKSEETPSSTPTVARGFQSRRKFQKPGESSSSSSADTTPTTATPRLPFSRGTSRFQRPTPSPGGSRFSSSKSDIQPTSASASSSGGSSPGGRARNTFSARGSSAAGARGRVTSSGFRGGSSSGFRGGASSSRFLPGRGRSTSSINPSATSGVTTVKPTQTSNADEEEYEVEYEYESNQPSSSTTTEAPTRGGSRFGGSNRFRLNPRLSTPASTAGTTPRAPTTRNLPFLRRQNFSKPTLPTRGTTPTTASTADTSSTAASGDDDEYEEIEVEEYEEEEKPSSSTTTTRPRPGLLGRSRPGGLSSLTARPSSRAPQATTSRSRSTTEATQGTRGTTTRRTYTPRPRPAGFPKPIGTTTKPTTTTEKPDSTLEEYYEEGDFEYEESKHLPGNITIDQASHGSELVETVVKPESELLDTAPSAIDEDSVMLTRYGGSGGDGSASAFVAAQDSVDTVDSLLSYAAGAPYGNIPGQEEAEGAQSQKRRRRRRSSNYRQVYDYYNSYNPYNYNYNQQQFGARSARGTLRSNFPTSNSNTRRSSSGSNSNYNSGSNSNTGISRGGPTYVTSSSDYDYVEYYDEPSPPPTTAAPARSAISTRLRGRIQPTPTSPRRTPFTLTHSDNTSPSTNTNTYNSNTNSRTSPTTRSRTSSYNSRGSSSFSSRPPSTSSNTNSNTRSFIPRRSTSRYQRPTEPPTTTSRSNRFRSRYNPRESLTTAAPSYSRGRFGTQLTRGRGSSTSNSIGSRYNSNSNSNDNSQFEASTITVTHFIPQETTFPVVNGKSTEYKTVLTPSASAEVLTPFQYTQIEYLGKLVLVKNDEVTSTVNPGVTEITQFLIRESPTSTVTFTPTTIRGRKTSFSHILPSTAYTVEPVVSTISNPLSPLLNNPNDPNQLTNLLLNQLLGLNPNLLGLQGQQLLMANLLNNNNPNPEPATPVTQYSTITTSYTTTVTDFTSTVIQITLHGKPLKTTILESSTKVISAVEYITSSTIITPSPPPQLLTQSTQQNQQAAFLQNLLQSQLLQQQLLQQQPIVPTQPPQLLLPQVQPTQVPLIQQIQQLRQQQEQQQQQLQQQQTQLPQELNKESDNNNKKDNENSNKEQTQQAKVEVTTAPQQQPEPSKVDGVPAGSSVVTVYVSDEDEGGGSSGFSESVEIGRGEVIRSLQTSLEDSDSESGIALVPEQRVSGGRLFIEKGRDFYTKVMSNGVGVIVRGHKTAHIGFDETPILPHRVSNRPITLPPHTVSRQFHLIESPGRPLNNAISHLLHSIVRSATPEMVTKTMLTTFTYLTTVLRHSNTIVKSREETISNIMTQRPSIDFMYTPSVKAEPSSLAPELLASFTGSSSYFTDTLTTTYFYFNTFTVDSLPVILTSRETVTNMVTLPVYMSPTVIDMMITGSKVFETETYFTTYTFSKTLLLSEESSEVVTTKEIITQVVVTEALAPHTPSQEPMHTPIPPLGAVTDEITKTYFTTFTHLFTVMDDQGQLSIRSSTSVSSEVVTETINLAPESNEMYPSDPSQYKIKITAMPTFTGWVKKSTIHHPNSHITMRSPSTLLPTRSVQIKDAITFTTIQPSETVDLAMKTLEPVMIYATKTYYTTYTYFTTLLGDGTRTKATVHSRTHIVSKVVTEALSTSFDAYYLNILKSSYLSKHSTMIDITSSVREIIPAKTMDPTERPGTLVTQEVSHPHWPKDNDELAMEIDGTTVNSIEGVEIPQQNKNPIQAEIHVSSASSEEHFDEIKEEVNHIVNVLTEGSEETPTSALSPSSTHESIYSTAQIFTHADPGIQVSETYGQGFVEPVLLKDPDELELEDFQTGENMESEFFTEKPVTHVPTPPLEVVTSSPVQPLTTTKPKTKKPLQPLSTVVVDLFPDIGPKPDKSTVIDYPPDVQEYSDEDDHVYSSLLSAGRYPYTTSILAKRTGTMVIEPASPVFQNPNEQIFSLASHLADGHHWSDYDETHKEPEEEEIPEPNIYKIHTTFDTFVIPTSLLVPVPVKSPTMQPFGSHTITFGGSGSGYYQYNRTGQNDGGDMKIHNLSVEDLFLDGSGSGSGEGPLLMEDIAEMGSGEAPTEPYIAVDLDYREDDHTTNPDGGEVIEEETEAVTSVTESSIPAFPPRTRYTTSKRPDKKKKTKRPFFDVETPSREEESGESSTKVYSLKVPHINILGIAGANVDSVSDESDVNNSEKKESEQEADDLSSESNERPQDDEFPAAPGPSKSSISFPVGVVPAPGSGPVASSTSGIDWKPLLKLGAIGLGGLGASSLTKLAPWFNSMAGSLMKGSLLPLARNDTSSSGSSFKDRDRDRNRPVYHRYPSNKDNPLIQHADPVYIDDHRDGPFRPHERPDDRIPRRPITSHAKEPNMRPVSLERDRDHDRDRDRFPPRGHHPYDGNDFPPRHNNFRPPHDRIPNIYSQNEENLHKNGEYKPDPHLRIINGPMDPHHSSSDLPVEGKTDFILRPIHNILNGKPIFDGPPKPGPTIPLRPFRTSGEVQKVPRPVFRPGDNRPHPPDGINDIPDSFDSPPSRKPFPDIPLLRPVSPNEEIILPHRVRGDGNDNNRRPPNPDILNAFKRPFRPKPLHPFRNSEEILNLKPPLPPRPSDGPHYSGESGGRPRPPHLGPQHSPPIHMSAPEMPNPFGDRDRDHHSGERPFSGRPSRPPMHDHHSERPFGSGPSRPPMHNPDHDHHSGERPFGTRPSRPPMHDHDRDHHSGERPYGSGPSRPPMHDHDRDHHSGERPYGSGPSRPPMHDHDDFEEHPFGARPSRPPIREDASEENVFKDIFGIRPSDTVEDHVKPPIGFHPHNQGEGPFQPLQSQESETHHEAPYDSNNPFGPLPVPHPTGVIGQPSDQFGNDQDDLSHEESSENPFLHGFSDFKKLHPTRKPSWPPLSSNSPMSYSYLDEQKKQEEFNRVQSGNDIAGSGSSPPPNYPAPPPLAFPPTRHVPPHLQRPSTVYIVHQEEMDAHTTTTPNPNPMLLNYSPASYDTEQDFGESLEVTTQYPKLIIKEVPTRPVVPYYRRTTSTSQTTTPTPIGGQNQTNRATIAKLFIRKFSTTTPYPNSNTNLEHTTSPPLSFVTWRTRLRPAYTSSTTASPPTTKSTTSLNGTNGESTDTLIDSWLVSPTVNDLQEFLEDFKNKFKSGSSSSNSSVDQAGNVILPQKSSTTTEGPHSGFDENDSFGDSEYDDDDMLDDDMSISASSETTNVSSTHPNHHPVHKPPIDADHFFNSGQGDFAQYYSGSEDRSTVVDPVNQKVVKTPFDERRRNATNILNRFRTSTSSTSRPSNRPIIFRNQSGDFFQEQGNGDELLGPSTPLENEIPGAPSPTTYRPRFDVTFHNKMGTTSEEPVGSSGPTTFRGDIMKPTTFRPGPDELSIGNRLRPDPTRDIISGSRPTTKRPAPQDGMSSFYDDDDSLSQLKMKNKEIHKLPSYRRKPGTLIPDVLEAVSDEDYDSTEKSKVVSTTSKSSTKSPNNKKGDEYDKQEDDYSEEYDSTYDEDSYFEIPPALPSPVIHSSVKNSAEGKLNTQYANPTTQPNSRRPGPLEMLTNFFRRPQQRLPSGGRIPYNPNSSREPTRTMLPPPINSKERPEIEYQANNFNPNVKTIPLNPNANKHGMSDPVLMLPKGTGTDNPLIITTLNPRESGERSTLKPSGDKNDQTLQTAGSNTVTTSPHSNNGIRESTYVEDSEYYEDDEMEDDKNNVIPPDEDNNEPKYTGPPIKFQPTVAPSNRKPSVDHRPITIGGHLVNNGHLFRPPTANQRRPPPQPGIIPARQPLPPPFGRPIFNPKLPIPHNPPLVQGEQPQTPKTEMEPPPIDSNRLKAPILELPSSGPIRYRPINNNVHRPNLLRPDDELFKPTTKASQTVHTIASVDDLNKIISTNTFTAIIPSDEDPTSPTDQNAAVEPSGVHLEGSETSVVVPHKSSGANIKMTSIVKYTGGRLETTEVAAGVPSEIPSIHTRGPNIIPTRASSVQTSITTSVTNRLPGLNRRPPFITRQSTTSQTSTSSTESSSGNSTNSSVRVTVTMESSVSSKESDTTTRKPFIPTRNPTRGNGFPWLRKPAVTSSESGETTTPSAATPSTTTEAASHPPRIRQPPTEEPLSKETGFSTTLRFSPSIFNISRGSSRPDILRRTTVVPPRISAPATQKPPKFSSTSSKSSTEQKEASKEVTSSSAESKERPSLIFPKLTTYKPGFRRPTLSYGGSSKSKEKFTTALINKVTTTSESPSPIRSVFSGILHGRNRTLQGNLSFTTQASATTTASTTMPTTNGPLTESFEYEYSDEYEDDDIELDDELDGERSKDSPSTTIRSNEDHSVADNSKSPHSTSTSSTISVSTSVSKVNESRVITVSSSEISPTRVSNNNNSNNNNGRSNRPKGILNTMVLRGGMTRVPDLPTTTKYVTHSETMTKTLTETETTVVVTAGTPLTHTIMITKTLPPQTLISTIVGSVTLVNSVDVKPTTVRSTIFAQPTKEVYSFIDTTEDLDDVVDNEENNVEDDNTRNGKHKIKHGGILTAGNWPRPVPPRSQTPTPSQIPKRDHPAPTTKEPKLVRNRPVAVESGCSANCTTGHGNQACRSYANGTKFKCDCKPGYARLKRKFPCRPTYTYELSLAINHMDGMSFDFKDLQNSATVAYHNFITVSKEAIEKAFLSTDIKRQFHGSEIMKLRPSNALNERTKAAEPKVFVDFIVQLTANVTEDRIRNHLIRTLKSSNFSVGRTGITSTKNMSDYAARDFNECSYSEFNDCSPNADCLNIRGSYTCRCRVGFRDKSPKKHKPGRDCYEMLGCPECNYKGHCRINARGEPFCECFRWFGGSKCHINLKILLFAIMGVVGILFIFVLLCSVLVCRRTKIHRERPGSGRFMRYRSPTSQATLDRAAIMNDSASSDGRQSPPRVTASFTPDSLVDGEPKQTMALRGDSLIAPDNVHLMNFSLRNVIMDQVQDRSLTVVIPRAKIRPPSRPPSIHATLGPDPCADLAASERKLINYLDHSPYPPAPYPLSRPPPPPGSRQSTIKRHDSRQFRKLSLQEQRKISSGALVSSGTEVSARGGMRRRSIGPEPEPTYSGYEKSFSDLRSITDTMRSPAQQQLFSTDTSRNSCYSHSCKPPSYCAYSEQSVGHTMGDKDGASTVYTTQGKLFRMAQDDTDSTASSQ